MYAPGQYYLSAGIMKIFGNNLMVIRVISALFMTILSLYVYKIASIMYSRKYAISVFVLVLVYGGWFNFSGSGLLTALMFLMIGLYCLMKYKDKSRSRNKKHYILAGLFFGISIVFRHDFAIYISLMSIVYFLIDYHDSKIINWKMIAGYLSVLSVCAILPYLIIIYYAGFSNVADQLIQIQFQVYSDYRRLQLPFPFRNMALMSVAVSLKYILSELFLLSFYLPYTIIGITTYCLAKKEIKDINRNSIIVIMVLSLLLLCQSTVRSDFEHIVPSLLFGFILLPYMILRLKTREMKLLVYLPLLVLLITPAVANKLNNAVNSFNLNGSEYLEVKGAENISIESQWEKQYKKTIEYIKSNTKHKERIFVCNTFNDRITYNDMMLYYLTQRLPATKYHELYPGVATEDYIQQEIIKSLQINRTKMIVKVDNNYSPEPNKSSISGSKRLDRFILLNYELVEQFGNYSILKAKGNF